MSACIATVGTFDGFHKGHQDLIEQLRDIAKERGLKTRIITFSNHPLEVIAPERAPKLLFRRSYVIEKLENCDVDRVSVINFTAELAALTAREFLCLLHERYDVAILLMGFNNSFGADRLASREAYINAGKDVGVEVLYAQEYIDEVYGVTPTSTLLRKYISEGEIQKFQDLSEDVFVLDGIVVKGKQNGRKIGFPTFNIDYDKRLAIPAKGVYSGLVSIKGHIDPAVINLGINPTIGEGNQLTLEVHAIDRRYGNCYGEYAEVVFTKKIRDEQKFNSLDELKKAIADDVKTVRNS